MPLFFEDIEVGSIYQSPTFTVERDEILEFAKRWDQLPIHLDDEAANKVYGRGGISAAGTFVLAVNSRLAHQLKDSFPAAVASFGFDEVRFHGPVQAGDVLHLDLEWIDKRDSQSRPDCGIAIAKNHIINQHGDAVMTRLDTLLVRRKNPPNPGR